MNKKTKEEEEEETETGIFIGFQVFRILNQVRKKKIIKAKNPYHKIKQKKNWPTEMSKIE